MNVTDVLQAQLVTEVGVAHEMGYRPRRGGRRITIHEAASALTTILTRHNVKMASILRRSAALRLVAHGDVEERFLKTPSDAHDLIAVALAAAAETQEYGEASTGSLRDLAAATNDRVSGSSAGRLRQRSGPADLRPRPPTAANLVAKVLSDEPTPPRPPKHCWSRAPSGPRS